MDEHLGTVELLILITGTISALASAVVTIVNGIRSRANATVVKEKLAQIATDTDGNLTAVRKDLTRANAAVETLHEVVRTVVENTTPKP